MKSGRTNVGEPDAAETKATVFAERPGHRVGIHVRSIDECPGERSADQEQPRQRGIAPPPGRAQCRLEARSHGVVDESASDKLREIAQRRLVQRRLAQDEQRNSDEAADVDGVVL
jgi:hypothetical protein